MFEKFSDWIRKSSAKVFTWPSRYKSEQLHDLATHAGQWVTPENSLQCSAVAACVRLLSETIAALPVHVYKDAGQSKELATDHPVYDLLHYSPNELQTAFTFWQQAMSHCLLHGNFYALIDRDSSRNPTGLWPLTPYGVTVEIVDGTIKYRYFYGGRKAEFDASEVLHFKGPTLDGVVGRSIVSMARQGIGLALAQELHAASLFKNNARPGLVLTVPVGGKLSKEAKENLKNSFESAFSGKNAHRVAILEEGLAAQPYGFTSEDAQFLESRQFSVIEIARWFRVPPTMIGDMTRVSYSSSESEMQLFAMHSLVPWCANFESEINAKLFPSRTKFSAKFDVNSIVRGDQESRYKAYSSGLMSGFLTVADVRQSEGLPFIPGTDKLMRPANVVPNTGESNGPDLPTP